jgi:hypothetical protein
MNRLFIGLFIASWALIGATCSFFETKFQVEQEQRNDIIYDPMLR